MFMILSITKKLIKKIPIAITKNQQYDAQTKKVISKVCRETSNCVDIGCHKGEVLDLMIAQSSEGTHFAFEPIPELFTNLKSKYKFINLFEIALSTKQGEATFNHVISNPAYSGLIKRKYDHENEIDQTITVKTDRLDNIIPTNIHIDLIKIDVEGGELFVLEGGIETIKRCKPTIIFEHGIGASEYYDSTPEKVFEYMKICGLQISTMKNWLNNKPAFTLNEFIFQFHSKLNYYFIAYPS